MLLVRKQEGLEGRTVCVPPEEHRREGPCLHGGSERGHTQHCWLGHGTGITGTTTGATGTISAY